MVGVGVARALVADVCYTHIHEIRDKRRLVHLYSQNTHPVPHTKILTRYACTLTYTRTYMHTHGGVHIRVSVHRTCACIACTCLVSALTRVRWPEVVAQGRHTRLCQGQGDTREHWVVPLRRTVPPRLAAQKEGPVQR